MRSAFRFFGRLWRPTLAAWLTVAAALPASGQPSDGYRRLLELYARGERAEALAGLERLSFNDLIQAYGELRAAALKPTLPVDTEADLRGLLRAAVMLHSDRDEEDRPPPTGTEQPRGCPGKQADLAGRYAALLARWPETRDFARRFFFATALRCQWDFCLEPALRWAKDGLKLFPRDPLLLLAAGSVLEEIATLADVKSAEGLGSLRQRQRDELQGALAAREQRFGEARQYFREALAADPALTLARVRLGRVLWRLREADAARTALEQAIAEGPEAKVLYLARLFLGRVHEDSGRLEPAIAEYRLALALDPKAQTAAVALSHALRLAGESEVSRQVLSQALAQAGQRTVADPYWNYLTSNVLRIEDTFDALRRETLQ